MYAYKRGADPKACLSYPTLPHNMQRGDAERLVRRLYPDLGLSRGQLTVLLALIDETRPSDWTRPDREPVCYAMQTNIARLCGQTTRSVRRTEQELSRLGIIRKEVASNGRRYRCRSAEGNESHCGIFFSPLIEAIPNLLELEKRQEQERLETNALKQKISVCRRMVRQKLQALLTDPHNPTALSEIQDTVTCWPARFDDKTANEVLRSLLDEVLDIDDRLDQLLAYRTPESGGSDSGVRHNIQDTKEDPIVTCKAPAADDGFEVVAEPPNPTVLKDEEQDSLEHGCNPETVDQISKHIAKLSPQRMFKLATEDFQHLISFYQGARRFPTERDFILASIDRLPALGIQPSAYHQSVETLGSFSAALCILVIDRNIDHPSTPVRSPGAVLRAMTRRHEQGQLNLIGSLIGLRTRDHLVEVSATQRGAPHAVSCNHRPCELPFR